MKARYIGSGHPDLAHGMIGEAHQCAGFHDPESHEYQTLTFAPEHADYAVYVGPEEVEGA